MESEKINSDLLKKYTENTCTEEERALVEEWLNSGTFDDVSADLSFELNKEKWKQEIWESLSTGTDIPRKKKERHFSLPNIVKYAACAAIFVVAFFEFSQRESLKNKYTDNQTFASQIVQVGDEPTLIVAERDSEIVFISTSSNQGDLYQKVDCEKGNTYLAIKVKYKTTHELLVIDQRYIQNLPPHLSMQIANQMKS